MNVQYRTVFPSNESVTSINVPRQQTNVDHKTIFPSKKMNVQYGTIFPSNESVTSINVPRQQTNVDHKTIPLLTALSSSRRKLEQCVYESVTRLERRNVRIIKHVQRRETRGKMYKYLTYSVHLPAKVIIISQGNNNKNFVSELAVTLSILQSQFIEKGFKKNRKFSTQCGVTVVFIYTRAKKSDLNP